jgi:hypothetical protein
LHSDRVLLNMTIWRDLGSRRAHCRDPDYRNTRYSRPGVKHPEQFLYCCGDHYNEAIPNGKESRPDLAAAFESGTFPAEGTRNEHTCRRNLKDVHRDLCREAFAGLYPAVSRDLRRTRTAELLLGIPLPSSKCSNSLTDWPRYLSGLHMKRLPACSIPTDAPSRYGDAFTPCGRYRLFLQLKR